MRDDGDVVLYRLAEHRRVWERGVAVPRVLGYTPSSEPVGDRLLIVSEYLAGQDGEDASRALPESALADAVHSVGMTLSELYQLLVQVFGDPVTGLRPGPRTWSEAVASRVEVLQCAYRDEAGGVSASRANRRTPGESTSSSASLASTRFQEPARAPGWQTRSSIAPTAIPRAPGRRRSRAWCTRPPR